jgi:Spy/CpxP family protein refolding chaperone
MMALTKAQRDAQEQTLRDKAEAYRAIVEAPPAGYVAPETTKETK